MKVPCLPVPENIPNILSSVQVVEVIKAIKAIINCRTSYYGANAKVCEDCGNLKISYNSCRNRHCPKCQSVAKEMWLDSKRDEIILKSRNFTYHVSKNTMISRTCRLVHGI